MRKLVFLQKEPLSRLGVAFLLTTGVTLPLLLALSLSGYIIGSLITALAVLIALTVLNATRKSRTLLWILLGAGTALQLFSPGMGLLGDAAEAVKALALYFSSYTVALPVFGAQAAGLITVAAAVLSYVFAKRGAGFLPAALVVVLVMFGLWSLGKGDLFWYAAPALVALLLQMSQAAHEKINILHVLPMALLAVLLAFLILPAGRLTLEPLSKAASDLKQTISDYLFFNKPRNVFTLGSYGFYPMGGGQLGGKAEPSEYPVMIVKTDRKTLLRAVVKDQYSGRSFTDTSNTKRYLYINPRWQAKRRSVFLELLPSDAIRRSSHLLDEKAVSVQMQNQAASTVFTPLFVRSLTMAQDMVPYFNDSSELFITRDLALGDHYTIYAPLLEGGDSGLEALVDASLKNDPDYQTILNNYTQLPSHMEQKVFDDVKNIVKNETTPYGKAMAIMRHLQKYYRYTLSPQTPPDNQDFVTYFLYVGKEGYCTYFASAMTVMCRMAGLPTRYVEGFLAVPSADGLAYVTGEDGHAWTEVYFEGFGWVPFDPTPLQQSNSNQPPESENQTEPSPSPSPEDQPTPTPDPQQPDDQPSPPPSEQPSEQPDDSPEDTPPETPPETPPDFPWALLLAAAALVALSLRVALRTPDRVARRMTSEKDRVFVYGSAVQRLLTYARRGPKNGETPLAFAHRVDGVRVFSTPILPLWRVLALSNYSRLEPTAEQTARARETFHGVYRGSHPLRRLRFLLSAAFDPRFYRVLETPAPHDKPTPPASYRPGKGAAGGKGKSFRAKPAPGKQSGGTAKGAPSGKNGARSASPYARPVKRNAAQGDNGSAQSASGEPASSGRRPDRQLPQNPSPRNERRPANPATPGNGEPRPTAKPPATKAPKSGKPEPVHHEEQPHPKPPQKASDAPVRQPSHKPPREPE